MRLLDDIYCLYLDFDSFFASVEQQLHKELRGKAIGITPFKGPGNRCLIACSTEAKRAGVSNVMMLDEAKKVCPNIILVPQNPALYRRAHNALLSEIESVLPISAIKSIDELTCDLDDYQRKSPERIAHNIKRNIAENIGPYIKCSIGFAANRQLAKMACKAGKPNGAMIWHPKIMPEPLFQLKLDDIPAVGSRMLRRLQGANIHTVRQLYEANPKHVRKLWRNVTGERLWYALHGYDIKAPENNRMMFGHGRILPPQNRALPAAREVARFLLIKAARRLRREDYYASGIYFSISLKSGYWSRSHPLPMIHDDQAVLAEFEIMWQTMRSETNAYDIAFKVGVTLFNISPANTRQLNFLLEDEQQRIKWEKVNQAMDDLNEKYGRTVTSMGVMPSQSKDNVGGKISFTRIPSAEDFW